MDVEGWCFMRLRVLGKRLLQSLSSEWNTNRYSIQTTSRLQCANGCRFC